MTDDVNAAMEKNIQTALVKALERVSISHHDMTYVSKMLVLTVLPQGQGEDVD